MQFGLYFSLPLKKIKRIELILCEGFTVVAWDIGFKELEKNTLAEIDFLLSTTFDI